MIPYVEFVNELVIAIKETIDSLYDLLEKCNQEDIPYLKMAIEMEYANYDFWIKDATVRPYNEGEQK